MFQLRLSKPCEIQGEIRLSKPPRYLGPTKDVDGNEWDIQGIFLRDGEYYVQAVPMSQLHPYYTDTSCATYSWVSQTWKPYRIEVVD